ncbi:MAG: MFS transporter [Coxiella sp. RIFCSPHIGHO2_12_FULL_44_14]|nr:MAG: MFS transporter [Coxiella sp. RIFCSPHIGHO2_12_FULL_44_14]
MTAFTKTIIKPLQQYQGAYPWIVWAVSMLFVLFQFFLQISSGVIIDGLMKDFSLSALGGGVLVSTYYYIYVLLQMPAGLLVDYFGPRRVLTIGAAVCALGCLLFGFSRVLSVAIVGRLLMGGGAAFAFVGSLNVVARWFPLNRFILLTGLAESIGMIGGILGGLFLAKLVQFLGWRHAMIGAAFLGFLISMLIGLIVRDRSDHHVSSPMTMIFDRSLWCDLKSLIRKKIAWINGAYSGLLFAVVTVFVALWGIPYIMLAYHVRLIIATLICDLVFLGVAIGTPLVGWLDGQIYHRRPLLIGGALGSAVLLSIVIYVPILPLGLLCVLMALLGILLSVYMLPFAIGNEIVPPHWRGASIGFVNCLSVAGAPLLQPLVGLILYLFTTHSGYGIDRYAVLHYQIALSVLPIILLLAAGLARYLPNRRQQETAPLK